MAGIMTNPISLRAQLNMVNSASELGKAIERLSSGLRINHSKDDAAGIAIANRFTASIRGNAQAARNASDGISLAQTTEGAINEINNNLQRIRELTIQALNGSNSQSDRTSLQNEIDQRLDEINRVTQQTDFNGLKVLSQQNSLKLQVGGRDEQALTINLEQMNTNTLGLRDYKVNGDRRATAGDLISQLHAKGNDLYTINGTTGTYLVDVQTSVVKLSGSAAGAPSTDLYFNSATGALSKEKERAVNPQHLKANTDSGLGDKLATDIGSAATAAFSILSTGTTSNATFQVGDITLTRTGVGSGRPVAGDYTATIGSTSVKFTLSGTSAATFKVKVTADVYQNSRNEFTLDGNTMPNRPARSMDVISLGKKTGSELSVTSPAGVTIQYKVDLNGKVTNPLAPGAAATEAIYLSYANGGLPVLKTESEVLVANTRDSIDPLSTIDAALNAVDSLRSKFGAVQNRLESTIATLNEAVLNLSAARSRIQDADYSVEMSNLVRNQILQQASTSLLAQANQVPNLVLALLK